MGGLPLTLAALLIILGHVEVGGGHGFAAGDDRVRAEAERALSDAADLLGSGRPEASPDAFARLETALRAWRLLHDEEREAETLLRRGLAHGERRQFRETLQDGEAALAIVRRRGDLIGEARALVLIGEAQDGLYELDAAIDALTRAIALRRALGDRAGVADLLSRLGWVHGRRGDQDRHLEFALAERALRRDLGDRSLEAWAVMSLGAAYANAGSSQEAIDTHREALAMFRALGDRASEGVAMQRLGAFYQGMGDNRGALAASEEAIAIFRVHGNAHAELTAYLVMGSAHLALGDAGKALELHSQALEIAREFGDAPTTAVSLSFVGTALTRLRRHEDARAHLGEAMRLATESKSVWAEAHVLMALGPLLAQSGQVGEARAAYQRAVEVSRSSNDLAGETKALHGLADIARDAGELAKARAHLEAAVANIERGRQRLAGAALRATFASSVQRTYELYVDVLMALDAREPGAGHRVLALEVAEAARARGLVDQLMEAGLKIQQGVEPALLAEERSAQGRLAAALDRQLRLAQDPDGKAGQEAAVRAVRTLTLEWEAVKAKIRATSPRFSALRDPPPMTVDQIRAQVLDDDTLLLEYALGEQRSFLWLVGRDILESFELPARAEIEAAVRAARPQVAEPVRRRAPARGANHLDRLGRMVLGPVAGRIDGKRLLIVPDGALHYVPFAALPEPDGSGDPLVAAHEIVAAPSASVVLLLRRDNPGSGRRASKTLAVLADPVFERDDERLPDAVRAPAPDAAGGPAAESPLAQALRSAGVERGLARLPFTRREARAILALVPADSRKGALDFDASRATAADASLGDYRFVHFATHGFLNGAQPSLSGIVLSLYDRAGAEARGFLTATDVFNLDLKADMVVLSGCHTALGEEIRGEGLVGLSRGFMYAGAPRVVASLWQVDDAATAELMKAFYRGLLKDGLPAGAALRRAQLQMWRRPRLRDPFYWAGFQLQGEWR
jgi:CHAT domain-containing protein/Flp pilus assembly protein TadD